LSNGKFAVLFLFVLFLFFGAGCCSHIIAKNIKNIKISPECYFDKKENILKASNSTVGLIYLDENNMPSFLYCTGFFINPTTIVTARHCIINPEIREELIALKKTVGEQAVLDLEYEKKYIGETIYFVTYNSYESFALDVSYKKATILYLTTKNIEKAIDDIAILQLEKGEKPSKHWLRLGQKYPEIGDKVSMVGMAIDMPWINTTGIFSQYLYDWRRVPKTIEIYLANITLGPGSSGSALLNPNGEVIGIASSAIMGTALGMFVPLEYVVKYLQDAKVDYRVLPEK